MIQHTTTLDSGRSLSMNIAPLGVAGRLKRIFFAVLKSANIEISPELVAAAVTRNPARLMAAIAGEDVNSVKNVFCALMASEELEDAVFDCMERCTLDGQNINRKLFEAEELRADLVPVAWEVAQINLRPFFEGLASLLPKKTESKAGTESPP